MGHCGIAYRKLLPVGKERLSRGSASTTKSMTSNILSPGSSKVSGACRAVCLTSAFQLEEMQIQRWLMWSQEPGACSPGTHQDLFMFQPYRLDCSSSKQCVMRARVMGTLSFNLTLNLSFNPCVVFTHNKLGMAGRSSHKPGKMKECLTERRRRSFSLCVCENP